jgi:hypothetical protein
MRPANKANNLTAIWLSSTCGILDIPQTLQVSTARYKDSFTFYENYSKHLQILYSAIEIL